MFTVNCSLDTTLQANRPTLLSALLLCGRPTGRITGIARPSVRSSVCPVRNLNSETKRRRIDVNVPQRRSNRYSNFQLIRSTVNGQWSRLSDDVKNVLEMTQISRRCFIYLGLADRGLAAVACWRPLQCMYARARCSKRIWSSATTWTAARRIHVGTRLVSVSVCTIQWLQCQTACGQTYRNVLPYCCSHYAVQRRI